MKYLIYLSTSVNLISDAELTDILTVSRRNNTASNLSGMLVYCNGTFIQILEGEQEDLDKTFLRIAFDNRHKGIIKVAEGEIAERNFADWSMAFITPNQAAMQKLEGYINPNEKDFLETDNKHEAISIIKAFAETNKVIS